MSEVPFISETDKIRPYIEKYLHGSICDVGAGTAKITQSAFGVDGRPLPGIDLVTNDLYNLSKKIIQFDCLYSGHCIEHLRNPFEAIIDWSKIIKQGGYIILQIPDAKFYNHYNNPEHVQFTEYESFIFMFRRCFCGESKDFTGNYIPAIFKMIESGTDYDKPNHYSFYLVAQKL